MLFSNRTLPISFVALFAELNSNYAYFVNISVRISTEETQRHASMTYHVNIENRRDFRWWCLFVCFKYHNLHLNSNKMIPDHNSLPFERHLANSVLNMVHCMKIRLVCVTAKIRYNKIYSTSVTSTCVFDGNKTNMTCAIDISRSFSHIWHTSFCTNTQH